MAENNGWTEYKNVVLYRLNEHGSQLTQIQAQLDSIKKDINEFKGAAKTVGAMWGTISGLAVGLITHFLGKLFNP